MAVNMSTAKDYLLNVMSPLLLMLVSFFFLGRTLLFSPFLLVTSPSAFRAKWFGDIFASYGPAFAASPLQSPYVEEILARARGVVLELGPGGGDQTFHFNANRIKMMYGAEPNTFLHAALMAKAEQNGLGTKYVPLQAGAQPRSLLPALRDAGIIPQDTSSLPKEGIFDTIVAVKSMCSAPQSQMMETMTVLWWLLKPGGEFLFFEHLENDESFLTQCYARVLNLLWPALMGGCRLDGKLDKTILRMNGWEKRDIKNIIQYQGYEVFRYAKGVCIKMC